ncbi:MAG: carbohydrate ABC transporter permease [Eubacteriales bacterium]
MKVKKIKRSSVILGIVLGAVLGVYVLSLFWMLGWGLITSLKDDIYFLRHVIGLPDKWMWSNYIRAFNSFLVNVTTSSGIRTVYLEEMFLNSVLYALGCAIASTTCACVMAYLSARFAYKFSKVTYTVVVVAMIVPIVGSLPSEIQMVTSLGLFGTFWGVWLLKANFLGMYFLVFYAVFKGVPKDFSEAAKIDGAGNFTLMVRIMFPLVASTYFTVLLLNFITFWNDYQIPLIYIRTRPTVAYGLFLFNLAGGGSVNTTPMKLAGSFLVMLPILIVFLVFQKRLMGNIHMGGLKE